MYYQVGILNACTITVSKINCIIFVFMNFVRIQTILIINITFFNL